MSGPKAGGPNRSLSTPAAELWELASASSPIERFHERAFSIIGKPVDQPNGQQQWTLPESDRQYALIVRFVAVEV